MESEAEKPSSSSPLPSNYVTIHDLKQRWLQQQQQQTKPSISIPEPKPEPEPEPKSQSDPKPTQKPNDVVAVNHVIIKPNVKVADDDFDDLSTAKTLTKNDNTHSNGDNQEKDNNNTDDHSKLSKNKYKKKHRHRRRNPNLNDIGPKSEPVAKLDPEQKPERELETGRKLRVITDKNEIGAEPELKLEMEMGQEQVEKKGKPRVRRDGRQNPKPTMAWERKDKTVPVGVNVGGSGGGGDVVKVETVKVSNVGHGRDTNCDDGRSGDDVVEVVKETNVGQGTDGRRGGNGRNQGVRKQLGQSSSSFGEREKRGELVWVKKGESPLVPN